MDEPSADTEPISEDIAAAWNGQRLARVLFASRMEIPWRLISWMIWSQLHEDGREAEGRFIQEEDGGLG